jgi:hypothetical protein
MWRSLCLVALGSAVGAAATFYFIDERSNELEAGRNTTETLAVDRREATTRAQRAPMPAVGERAVLYQRVADGDVAAIERLARIDGDLLAAAFRALAENDPNAALGALARIDDSRQATAIGLALLPALGNDARAVETIAARLRGDVEQFRIDAFAARAASSPEEALQDALELTDRRMLFAAARNVITAWARRDAQAALARIEAIEDTGLQFDLERQALNAWTSADPEALLTYLAGIEPQRQQRLFFQGGLQLAGVDPARIFELANRLPPERSTILRQSAFTALATQDPLAALAYADTVPAGQQRRQLYQQIAQGYGRKDPDAALAWARGLRPPIPGLLPMVYVGIALQDTARALDLAMAIESPNERTQVIQQIAMSSVRPGGDTRAIADKILTLPDNANRRSTLQMLASIWGQQSPREATEWLLAHQEQVNDESFRQIGPRFAQQDPEAAAAYLDRVPAEARGDWITAVALGYARTDPQNALTWVGRFRGEPAYDPAAAAVAQALASYDPRGAATLVRTIDTSRQELRGVMTNVAQQWAMTDPHGAADWALEFDAPETRSEALAGIGRAWASYDTGAAGAWALTMPVGANRDAALTGAVQMIGSVESLDQALLRAFSNDSARQQAVLRALPQVAQRDSDEARRLLDEYLSDPALRRQAEQMLASSTQGRASARAMMMNQVGVMNGVPFGVPPFAIGPPPAMVAPTPPVPSRREGRN